MEISVTQEKGKVPVSEVHIKGELDASSYRELVTIGILFSLKGGYFRAFYRWLERDYGDWFGQGELPERTRLQRLLKTHQDWCDMLMAEVTFFTVIDTYPIELLFPIREGRSKQQVGKKNKDNRDQAMLVAQRNLSRGRLGLEHHECA